MLRVLRRVDVQFRGIKRLHEGQLLDETKLDRAFVAKLKRLPNIVEEVVEEKKVEPVLTRAVVTETVDLPPIEKTTKTKRRKGGSDGGS